MHIAIDVRSLMEGRHSGVEEYTTRIIDAMAETSPQHNYHLFYNAAKPVQLPVFRENVSVYSFRYPNKVFNASQLLLRSPRWDKLLPAHMDVFFIPNARLVPLSSDVPLVTVAHDISFERFPEFLTWRRRLWHAAMQPKTLMQKSNHVIAVSEHTKNDLMEYYTLSEAKVTVVYPGVPTEDALVRPIDVQHIRNRYTLPERFILFFGALEPRKNIPSIIEAFSAIADRVGHHLVLAGEKGWKADEIERAIESSLYKHKIHTIGFVQEQDKHALYAAADVFVYPSFYEGFGFPPLEALLAGTPVVVSFNASLPEVVGEFATLVDPYNTPQLALVLAELLQSPERVPADVRQKIRERFNWTRAAQQTVKILESVA